MQSETMFLSFLATKIYVASIIEIIAIDAQFGIRLI